MNHSHDQHMQLRIILNAMIDDLRSMSAHASPLHYMNAIERIRSTARQNDSPALADVMSKLESALQGARSGRDAHGLTQRYLEWVDTAMGCAAHDVAAQDALRAAIAVRHAGL